VTKGELLRAGGCTSVQNPAAVGAKGLYLVPGKGRGSQIQNSPALRGEKKEISLYFCLTKARMRPENGNRF